MFLGEEPNASSQGPHNPFLESEWEERRSEPGATCSIGQDSIPKPRAVLLVVKSSSSAPAHTRCTPHVPGNTSGPSAATHVQQSCTVLSLHSCTHTHNARRAHRPQSLRAGTCEGRQDPPLPVPRRTASQQHVPAYGGRQVSDRRWARQAAIRSQQSLCLQSHSLLDCMHPHNRIQVLGRQVGQDHVQVQLWDVAGDVQQQQQAWPVLSKVGGAGRCLHKQGVGRVDALQREQRAFLSHHVTQKARCLCRDASSAAQHPATKPACAAAQENPAQLRPQRMTDGHQSCVLRTCRTWTESFS